MYVHTHTSEDNQYSEPPFKVDVYINILNNLLEMFFKTLKKYLNKLCTYTPNSGTRNKGLYKNEMIHERA